MEWVWGETNYYKPWICASFIVNGGSFDGKRYTRPRAKHDGYTAQGENDTESPDGSGRKETTGMRFLYELRDMEFIFVCVLLGL